MHKNILLPALTAAAIASVCLAGCGEINSSNSSERVSSAASSSPQSDPDTKTPDSSYSDSELPEEAHQALLAYLNSDSYEELADSILPTAAAQEAKNGKNIVGYYYFGYGPTGCEEVTDINISECSRLPKDRAEFLGSFWSAGFAMQGFTSEFEAEDGYEVVVSAVCTIKSDEDIDIPGSEITSRLEILKIKDDRWIVVPSTDTQTQFLEQTE